MPLPPSFPSSLRPLVGNAEALAERRDWDAAIACYERVLSALPNDAYTLVQLSYMESLRGAYRRAEECALAAAQTGTTDPPVLLELLPRLRTFNRVPEMLACIEGLPPAAMPIPLLIAVAAQLTYVNLPERAIEYLDEARRADPDYPTTLLARTQVLTYLGRFQEAEQDVKRAIRKAPEIAQGYWLQSALRRQTVENNHVAAITRELQRPSRTADDVALLEFALHKELDDLGRYDEAWQSLIRGCSAKRSRLKYHDAGNARLFAALHSFEAPGTSPPSFSGSLTPVFIVGMHRSGTTLLEQLLAGHSEVHAIGELYDFTSAMRYGTDHHCKGVIDETIVERAKTADFAAIGRHYLGSVGWRVQGKRLFTDKLPSNFLNVGFIARAIPQAKILHMVRDPREVCFSNLRELFSDANAFSYDLGELAAYFDRYTSLMRHWHHQFEGRILDVSYANLVSDPAGELRKVAAFCGINFEDGMIHLDARTRGVVTASAVPVRGGIQAPSRAKWMPYEKYLAPLFERLPLARDT